MVPDRRRVYFKMGQVMKKRVNNGAAPASETTAEPVATGSESLS